jgi:hypothetical protein
MDAIIGGGLLAPHCAHDKEHGVVMVWSSGAEEQIEAITDREVDEVRRKWESDQRIMRGMAQLLKERGISAGASDIIEAARRFLPTTSPPER